MSNPSFAAGLGTPVISDAGVARHERRHLDQAERHAATGIVVMANNADEQDLLAHRRSRWRHAAADR